LELKNWHRKLWSFKSLFLQHPTTMPLACVVYGCMCCVCVCEREREREREEEEEEEKERG
jgi:hypothetical protein